MGLFNACSAQWGVSNNELGEQYGGLLAACKNQFNYNGSLEDYKQCLASRCDTLFASRGLTELYQGCMFHVEWMQAADNPGLRYKEVPCPAELTARSGMDRSFLNDVSNACGD